LLYSFLVYFTRSELFIFGKSLTNIKHWSVGEYHQINDLGIIDPDERTELIAGQIIMMAAKGTAHVLTLRLLASVLASLLGDRSVFVSTHRSDSTR
jgi:Uma2 family endonuclease